MRDYILIAGPNGAGKSTLYDICPQFKALTYVNFDRFARNGLKDAARKAVTLIDSSFTSGTSFIQETTLCGKSILFNIERAKNAGYRLIIHFVGLESADLAMTRIRHRVAVGGHGIPETDVRRRYTGSMERIAELIGTADEIYFYDNSSALIRLSKWIQGSEVWKSSHSCGWYENLVKPFL